MPRVSDRTVGFVLAGAELHGDQADGDAQDEGGEDLESERRQQLADGAAGVGRLLGAGSGTHGSPSVGGRRMRATGDNVRSVGSFPGRM